MACSELSYPADNEDLHHDNEDIPYESDFSHGNQNYFDSHHDQPSVGCATMEGKGEGAERRSGVFGITVQEAPPTKRYHTPAVPRTVCRNLLQAISTPNEKEVKPVPLTIKEQIKTNFGFDDSSEDEQTDENESLNISPVRRVPGHSV